MTLRVRCFARAKDLAGGDALFVELPEGATVADLRRSLVRLCPALAPLLDHCAIAVDDAFAENDMTLTAAHNVALLPPVSGG